MCSELRSSADESPRAHTSAIILVVGTACKISTETERAREPLGLQGYIINRFDASYYALVWATEIVKCTQFASLLRRRHMRGHFEVVNADRPTPVSRQFSS